MNEHILLVEDDEKLSRMVELELKYEGYAVTKAYDGRSGLEQAVAGPCDLVLLDIMLPQLSGMEVLRRLRREKPLLPVIMVTARDSVTDKVSGLDSGADDYITKPFAIEELLARIRTALRKHAKAAAAPAEENAYTVQDVRLEKDARRVLVNGTEVKLTRKEFDLLVPDGAPGQGHGPLVPAGAGVGLRLCRRDQLGGRGCPIPAQQDRRALWADPH